MMEGCKLGVALGCSESRVFYFSDVSPLFLKRDWGLSSKICWSLNSIKGVVKRHLSRLLCSMCTCEVVAYKC